MAMAHGLPIVSTPAGAEDLALQDGVNALLADNVTRFAAAVAQVYQDGQLWQSLADHGRSYIAMEFSPARAEQGIQRAMEVLRTTQLAARARGHHWSVRIVEGLQPAILTEAESNVSRTMERRILGYTEYAERLLDAGRPMEARSQLRHVFSFLRGPLPEHPFFARIWMALEQCYRELGEPERGRQCGQEALRFIPEFNPRMARAWTGGRDAPAAMPAKRA